MSCTIESFKKFDDKNVNLIRVITDEIPINGYMYIDFEHYPSQEFEVIGDRIATITIKNIKKEEVNQIINNLKNFNLPIEEI